MQPKQSVKKISIVSILLKDKRYIQKLFISIEGYEKTILAYLKNNYEQYEYNFDQEILLAEIYQKLMFIRVQLGEILNAIKELEVEEVKE